MRQQVLRHDSKQRASSGISQDDNVEKVNKFELDLTELSSQNCALNGSSMGRYTRSAVCVLE